MWRAIPGHPCIEISGPSVAASSLRETCGFKREGETMAWLSKMMGVACVVSLGAACGQGPEAPELDELGVSDAELTHVVRATGPWTIFTEPYGRGLPNPAEEIEGRILAAKTARARTLILLNVDGLKPDTAFTSHVHVLPCAENKGGGHYQNELPPSGTSSSDVRFVNSDNEIWLDFVTDGNGSGMAYAAKDFLIRPGGAQSVIIHGPKVDGASPKVACLDVPF
jgi:hypothetical protein